MIKTIPTELGSYGRRVYSQNDEDGVIEVLCECLQIESGFFVEFGIGPPNPGSLSLNGLEGNCRLLRERGWSGLFMDGSEYPPKYDVKTEYITALNINMLLDKYGCPQDIDIFSIDVDGQDFWIWMNLGRRPKIVIIEYNCDFEAGESYVVPFNIGFRWDCTRYMGASLSAMCKLGASKGYRPVYANYVNIFFVRDDLITNKEDFPEELTLPRRTLHRDYTDTRFWIEV
jgi:hypothetical protein